MQATVEKIVPGGQALATLENGKKAFIWNALPGEVVEFEITKNKSSYCEGISTNIITPSKNRVSPHDDCFLATSPWQILNYEEELVQKNTIVDECFTQHHIRTNIMPVVTDGKEYNYRNKMEYSLYWNKDDEKIYPAFHMRGTHKKIPIKQSSIERAEIFTKATEIIAELNSKHAEARTYQSLIIRCDQHGNTSAALFENKKPHPNMNPLQDTLLGKTYTYSPNGFFQINLPVYELALKEIAKHIQTQKVLDLYAGVGSIGLSVANEKDLTLVEINAAAFSEMENNAKNSSAKCVLAKSEDVTEYITPDCTVILDPPRAGCDQKLIESIQKIKPAKIIYLSCNPITQARDIANIIADYRIEKVQPYNFFPRTPHVENLAILSKV